MASYKVKGKFHYRHPGKDWHTYEDGDELELDAGLAAKLRRSAKVRGADLVPLGEAQSAKKGLKKSLKKSSGNGKKRSRRSKE